MTSTFSVSKRIKKILVTTAMLTAAVLPLSAPFQYAPCPLPSLPTVYAAAAASSSAAEQLEKCARKVAFLVNEERAQRNLPPLKYAPAVSTVARLRSKETQQLFSHTRPNNTSCFTALDEAKINYDTAGENIAYGQPTPEAVMEAWMNSKGHRENILSSSYEYIGVGVTYSDGLYYWAQLFVSADNVTGAVPTDPDAEARILLQPADATAGAGGNVTFTVEAEGEGISYRWQLSDDGGKTWYNSTVTKPAYTAKLGSNNNGRAVRCTVTDQFGNKAYSDAAFMRISPLTILSQPKDCTAAAGQTASFSVTAGGGLDCRYQWQYSTDGGKTWKSADCDKSTYAPVMQTSFDGRLVRCTVTDQYGVKLLSDTAAMKLSPLKITQQPADAYGVPDGKVTFAVKAEGDGISYRWQLSDDGGKKWYNSTVTKSTYTAALTQNNNGRLVRCVVSDKDGAQLVSSAAAMKQSSLAIIQQPSNAIGALGQTVHFTVKATGDGLSYQWQLSDTLGESWYNSSVKKPTYPVTLGSNNNGRLVRCVVTDANGAKVVSFSAAMKLSSLRITSQPTDAAAVKGGKATFTVTAKGDSLAYQWQLSDDNGKTWYNSTVTKNTYTVTLGDNNNGRLVHCIVTDRYGAKVASDAAVMHVSPLKITLQPKDTAGAMNEKITFTVSAEGENPAYQWQLSDDGGSKWYNSSVKKSSYTVALGNNNNGRLVRCIVTDPLGAKLVSRAAAMTVSPIVITQQPKDATGAMNAKVTFTVAARGSELSYQWQLSDNQGRTWYNSSVKKPTYTVTLGDNNDGRFVRCILTDSDGAQVISHSAVMRIG